MISDIWVYKIVRPFRLTQPDDGGTLFVFAEGSIVNEAHNLRTPDLRKIAERIRQLPETIQIHNQPPCDIALLAGDAQEDRKVLEMFPLSTEEMHRLARLLRS